MFIFSLLLLPTSMPVWSAETGLAMEDVIPTMTTLNINQATDKQLATIKGIGEQKATAIINYRTLNGDFKKLEDLQKVKGIGEATFNKVKPFLSL